MQTLRPEVENCPCSICRSDMAYIHPCMFKDSIEFTVIEVKNEEKGVTSSVKAAPKGPRFW